LIENLGALGGGALAERWFVIHARNATHDSLLKPELRAAF
jgi:hypothetical protein